jgi:glycosyltransferase involved in cell wall biosynthesis
MNGDRAPRKIGLIAPYFPPQIGGATIYCQELAKAIAGKGYDVHVFSHRDALSDPAYMLHPVLSLDLGKDLEHLEAFDMDVWHSLYFFYAPLALRKPNVFVTGHGDDFFSLRIRRTLPVRRWAARHVTWRLNESTRANVDSLLQKLEFALNRRWYRRAMRSTRQVIAVSSYSKARFCAEFPEAADKTTVIPPGVTDRFFTNDACAKQTNLLLTVTRLDEADRIKNVHGVIMALAGLKDDYDFQYRIVAGSVRGGYRDELERLIVERGLERKVTIEGRKSEEELASYYARAGLFILASYAEPKNFEGFGIVFLEANAAGTPVLTTREGGMVDYVREGVNGFFVEDPSPIGIKAALERYLKHELVFDTAKVRRAPEPYRWTHIADRVLGVYATFGS